MTERIPRDVQTYRKYLQLGCVSVALGAWALYEATVLISPEESQIMDQYSACVREEAMVVMEAPCEHGPGYPSSGELYMQSFATIAGLALVSGGMTVSVLAGSQMRDHSRFIEAVSTFNAEPLTSDIQPWPAIEDL